MKCYHCEEQIKLEGEELIIFHETCFHEWDDESHKYDGWPAEDI